MRLSSRCQLWSGMSQSSRKGKGGKTSRGPWLHRKNGSRLYLSRWNIIRPAVTTESQHGMITQGFPYPSVWCRSSDRVTWAVSGEKMRVTSVVSCKNQIVWVGWWHMETDCPVLPCHKTSLLAQTVKCLPTKQETQWFLGQEGTLEKEMATYPSILAWEIPWMEEPGRLQSIRSQRVNTTEWLHFHFSTCLSICSWLFGLLCAL